jgi:hypothetical protein
MPGKAFCESVLNVADGKDAVVDGSVHCRRVASSDTGS